MLLVPALIMFAITVAVVSLFMLPATYDRKSAVVNFYWVGAWLLLALLAAISGGEQTALLLGVGESDLAMRLQRSLVICIPVFAVAAWLRLSGLVLMKGLQRIRR